MKQRDNAIYRTICPTFGFRGLGQHLVASVVIWSAVLAGVGTAHAAGFSTKAKQAILMDARTGAVLFQHNADEVVPPASMSKLMTLALIFEALKTGKLTLETTFTVSEHAWRTGGAPSGTSAMFAPLGKMVSVEDLVKGIAIQSGNDACIVVAEGMAGGEAAFAKRMTDYARKIGLEKSNFGNPTGLPHPDQVMTAREIAILARHIIDEYPEYYHYFAMKKFPYQPKGKRRPYAFFNRNPLLSAGIGADGLKTGHLKASGYGLVASAVQDGRRLIAVVHGLPSSGARKTEGRKLLEWGFRNFSKHKLFDEDEVVGSARVLGGDHFYVPLVGDGEIYVVLPKFPAKPKLYAEVRYKGPLKPPIKRGDQVAILRVVSSTKAVNEIPLFAAEDVAEASVVRRGLDTLAIVGMRWASDKVTEVLSEATDN